MKVKFMLKRGWSYIKTMVEGVQEMVNKSITEFIRCIMTMQQYLYYIKQIITNVEVKRVDLKAMDIVKSIINMSFDLYVSAIIGFSNDCPNVGGTAINVSIILSMKKKWSSNGFKISRGYISAVDSSHNEFGSEKCSWKRITPTFEI